MSHARSSFENLFLQRKREILRVNFQIKILENGLSMVSEESAIGKNGERMRLVLAPHQLMGINEMDPQRSQLTETRAEETLVSSAIAEQIYGR